MLNVLHDIERSLPALLASRDGWESLDIDYHPPRVERLYRTIGEYRLYLHVIHPCAPEDALFHPHPWPSAMRVLGVPEGRYEMGVGYGAGDVAPPIAARMIASGEMEYEMTDRDAWHYVRAIGEPAITIMVTGRPWGRAAPRSERPLSPLAPARVDELLEVFRRRY
jgi:hypothetical protein